MESGKSVPYMSIEALKKKRGMPGVEKRER